MVSELVWGNNENRPPPEIYYPCWTFQVVVLISVTFFPFSPPTICFFKFKRLFGQPQPAIATPPVTFPEGDPTIQLAKIQSVLFRPLLPQLVFYVPHAHDLCHAKNHQPVPQTGTWQHVQHLFKLQFAYGGCLSCVTITLDFGPDPTCFWRCHFCNSIFQPNRFCFLFMTARGSSVPAALPTTRSTTLEDPYPVVLPPSEMFCVPSSLDFAKKISYAVAVCSHTVSFPWWFQYPDTFSVAHVLLI